MQWKIEKAIHDNRKTQQQEVGTNIKSRLRPRPSNLAIAIQMCRLVFANRPNTQTKHTRAIAWYGRRGQKPRDIARAHSMLFRRLCSQTNVTGFTQQAKSTTIKQNVYTTEANSRVENVSVFTLYTKSIV